jgi:hypothetical protein
MKDNHFWRGLFWGMLIILVIVSAVGAYALHRSSEISKANNFVDKVSIPASLVTFLNEKYSSTSDEFVVCLNGDVVGGVVVVDSWTLPKITFANESVVLSEACFRSNNLLSFVEKYVLGFDRSRISLHSHPVSGGCGLSGTDIFSFGVRSARDLHGATGIICGVDELAFYTENNFDKAISLSIRQNE